MKKLVAPLFLSLSTAAFAQTPVAETTTLSPAEKSIAAARKEITNKPAQYAATIISRLRCRGAPAKRRTQFTTRRPKRR